ncbi:hypothetical protein DIPPA_21776 [Diplonema papillatum]|nr:hypothetical protein DIPPA_21776 [Diplonema papillatum]
MQPPPGPAPMKGSFRQSFAYGHESSTRDAETPPGGAEPPATASAARPLVEADVLFRFFVSPVSMKNVCEGSSILRYCYPPNDKIVDTVHSMLHNVFVHIREATGSYARRAFLRRGGVRLLAVFHTVPNPKHEDGSLLACSLWTIGELAGGLVAPTIKVPAPVLKDIVEVITENHVRRCLEIRGNRVTKLDYDVQTRVVTTPDVDNFALKLDLATCARLQRLADTVNGVKHNISMREVPYTIPVLWEAASQAILNSIHLLWPHLREAYLDTLTEYLSSIEAQFTQVLLPFHCSSFPSAAFQPEILQEAAFAAMSGGPAGIGMSNFGIRLLPFGANDAVQASFSETLKPSHGGPLYAPCGQVICYGGCCLSTTLRPRLTHAIIFHLSAIGFMQGSSQGDLLVDTIMLTPPRQAKDREEANLGANTVVLSSHQPAPVGWGGGDVVQQTDSDSLVTVKGLLVVYRKDDVTVVSILAPSYLPGTGINSSQAVDEVKATAHELLQKGLFASRQRTYHPVPKDVQQYQLCCKGGDVVVTNSADQRFISLLFSHFAPYVRQFLATSCKEYSLHVRSPDSKGKPGVYVKGWRASKGEDIILIHDDNLSPVLPSLFCKLAACVPV